MPTFDTFIPVYDGTIEADVVAFNAGAGVVRLNDGDDTATILGGAGAVFGDAGNDVISADRVDTLSGGSGDDALTTSADASLLDGGDGNDTIEAAGGTMATLGEGDDVLTASSWLGIVEAGIGNDVVSLAGAGEVSLGTGSDRLTSTAYLGRLDAGDGRDIVALQLGAGSIDLGTGRDTFVADGYVSDVFGSSGNDQLRLLGGGIARGGEGDDALSNGDGGWRNVSLYGEGGQDRFVFDLTSADAATAIVDGGTGADTLVIEIERSDGAWAYRADIVAELDGRGVGDSVYHSDLLNLDIRSVSSIVVDL